MGDGSKLIAWPGIFHSDAREVEFTGIRFGLQYFFVLFLGLDFCDEVISGNGW